MLDIIAGTVEEKAHRVPDQIYYQQVYFEARLKDLAHARFDAVNDEWQRDGADPTKRPQWLKTLRAVTQEQWEAETADFREEVCAANREDHKQRVAEAEKLNEQACM